MKTDYEMLLPEDISDETAAVLSEFLYTLALACESRYFMQLERHHKRQYDLLDPDRPWIRATMKQPSPRAKKKRK